jgi:hypothetical protein
MTNVITQLYGSSHEGFTPLDNLLLSNDDNHKYGYGAWVEHEIVEGLSLFISPRNKIVIGLLARCALCTISAVNENSEGK